MALNFFYAYLGVFLTCSVALAVVVKKMVAGFAASGKKPYVYGVASSSVASGATYLSVWISDHLFTTFWVLAAIYLLFGVVHMMIVHNKYFYAGKQDEWKVFAGEIIFGLSIIFFTIVVFSALQYFVSADKEFLFYPVLLSTLTFFIPFLFMKSFEKAAAIPPAVFHTWKYPLNEQIDVPDEKPGEKLLVIGFEIAKKPNDSKRTPFRAKAPEGMTLGDLYYHFINDYNDSASETPIGFADEAHESHEWWFRRKVKWYQQERILDPAVTIRENKITEDMVIICERLTNHIQS